MFSLKAKFEIAYTAINKNTNGIAVIIEALLLINKIYKMKNNAEISNFKFTNQIMIHTKTIQKIRDYIL